MPNPKDFLPRLPWEGLPFPKFGGGTFQPGGYRSFPELEAKMVTRLEPYIEDERKAVIDYENEATFAYDIGRPDIATTLRSMSEDENRHYLNLREMINDLMRGGVTK